jgi:hypothetical protein
MLEEEYKSFTAEEKVSGIEDMNWESIGFCNSSYLEKIDLTLIDRPNSSITELLPNPI